MSFFFDNNLSPQLSQGLKAFGEDVIHLKELFDEDEEDPIWLEYVGTNGHVLITRDDRVRRNPSEVEAIREHRVGAFFLGGKNRSRCELIQQVVRNWPRIKETAKKTNVPFAFRVPPSGTKLDRIPLPT